MAIVRCQSACPFNTQPTLPLLPFCHRSLPLSSNTTYIHGIHRRPPWGMSLDCSIHSHSFTAHSCACACSFWRSACAQLLPTAIATAISDTAKQTQAHSQQTATVVDLHHKQTTPQLLLRDGDRSRLPVSGCATASARVCSECQRRSQSSVSRLSQQHVGCGRV